MTDTKKLSAAAERILNSHQGDGDEALIDLYDQMKSSENKSHIAELKVFYNQIVDYLNGIKGFIMYKTMP
jgi:hypothetical protein